MVDEPDIALPETLSVETVYEGHLFDVELHRLRMANGVEALREQIQHPGAVAMVAVDHDGKLLMVTQYRHSAGRRLLELPAGTLEPGEDIRAAAVRELQEEVHRHPGRVEALGGFFVAPGYTTEYIHLFVCSDLSESVLEGDEDEDIAVHTLTLDEALAAIERGEIVDAKSVVGVLRYARGVEA
ncbi:MAG: NUDIX hydrolase [Dehalococcoidia bacterium]|nr:NUDIX hydrolase [Dehalococcoidia bacterium]